MPLPLCGLSFLLFLNFIVVRLKHKLLPLLSPTLLQPDSFSKPTALYWRQNHIILPSGQASSSGRTHSGWSNGSIKCRRIPNISGNGMSLTLETRKSPQTWNLKPPRGFCWLFTLGVLKPFQLETQMWNWTSVTHIVIQQPKLRTK
jgi:hypothetical protein